MTIPSSERVRPVKWESIADGGGQNDEVPTGLKSTEDAIEARGYYGQPTGGPKDEDVAIYRDGDNWKFVDKVITDARSLLDLTSGGKVATAQTTDDTATQIYALSLPVSKSVTIKITATCRNSAGSIRGTWQLHGLAHRLSEGDAILDYVLTLTEYKTAQGLSCDFTVNGNDIRLTIAGLASTTLDWVSTITTTPFV